MNHIKSVMLAGCLFLLLFTFTFQHGSANQPQNLQLGQSRQENWPVAGAAVGNLRFEQLGVQEGLSENAVLAIHQDAQGFLWIGTREGLNKFDGYHFTIFKADPNDPESLSDDHITAIEESLDGSLWVGTYYHGLNRLDRTNNVFSHFSFDPDDPSMLLDVRVNALLVDSHGDLWVGSPAGLSLYQPEKHSFMHYYQEPDNPASLSNSDVRSLHEDGNGNLWVGTANGLNLLDREKNSFTRFLTGISSGISVITAISDGGGDALWLGSQGGLIQFNHDTYAYGIFQHDPNDLNSLSSNHVTSLRRDRSGDLWIGFEDQGVNLVTSVTDEGLQITDYQHQVFNPNSLSHNEVRVIVEDEGGMIWIGTFGGGINKANPTTRAFGYLQHEPGNLNTLGGDEITALAMDAPRRSLWIGTAESGLDRMNLITGEFEHYQHDPDDVNSLDHAAVTLLHVSPRGNLYVGTEGGILKEFDPSVNGFVPALSKLVGYRIDSSTTAVTHDTSGMLWLSQDSGELLKIDPAGDTIIRFSLDTNSFGATQDYRVLDIYVDPQGIVWLATDSAGLLRFDPEQRTLNTLDADGTSNRPNHNSLTNIYADREGVLWLGTAGGGLNRFDPETGMFTYYTTLEDLPSNRVFGIQQDAYDNLWLSTGNGLVKINPENLNVNNFSIRDGLQGNTYNQNAHAASADGLLFFGGVNGLNVFYPGQIEENDHIPPIAISSVSLFNEVLLTDISGCSAAISLTHDQNFLSFEFTALDFTELGENTYAYMLEGLDSDFIYAGNKRNADYPNLAWGNYTFRLIGANNDGAWNNSGACVSITIQPPFWATWWFITLVGLFLAGSVMAGYRLRVRAVEQQRQVLVEEVFVRTKEIERRRQMATGLSEVIRLLNTNQSIEKSLDFIVKQSVGLTSASKAAIFERQGNLVVARACYPEGGTFTVDLSNPNSPSAICLLESTFINRLLIYSRVDPKTMKSDTRWELVSGDYRTILCTPLLVEDKVYGGLVLYYGEDRTFTPEEITLAHTLADQASLAIVNEQLKDKAQDIAVVAERNRLARELHDAVTQTLFSTSLIADVLPKIWQKNPESARERLEELKQLTRGALGEMRTLLMELRPSALRDADPAELFKHLTDAFTGRTGVPVLFELTIPAACVLPGEVKEVFYRVSQEGFNNIFKHADATRVWFRFFCDDHSVTLTISDNGQGFDPEDVPAGHFGLEIMTERAESIGANFTLVSQPDEGTTLRLVWNFDEDAIK